MSSTSQEKINQVPIYYAKNSSYLYGSHTVTLVSLLASYVPFVSLKNKQISFKINTSTKWKSKKSSQLASLMEGW